MLNHINIRPIALWATGLITVALVLLTTSFAPSAHADDSAPATATESNPVTVNTGTAQRMSARRAKAVYQRLVRQVRADQERYGRRARPITDLRRIRRLPDAMRTSIYRTDLVDSDYNGRLDRPRLSFTVGDGRLASCLYLLTGRITRGACGQAAVAVRSALIDTYNVLVRTTIWHDQRRNVLHRSADDVSLIRSIVASEFPTGVTLTFADDNHDALVDDGTVTLRDVANQWCGQVTLPNRGTDGEYTAVMVSC